MGKSTPTYSVHGHVEPGFEACRDQFEQSFKQGFDKNAQLCVYVGQKCVIDIYGKTKLKNQKQEFDADSTTTIWSSGKSVGSIMMAVARDKKWLSYDQKVSECWPEYGNSGCGKGDTTISEVLKHEAGLERLCETISSDDI